MTRTEKIDNVVYILGAGFSAPLGIPVMANFLEKSKNMFALESDKFSNFAKVFETIDRMSKAKNYFNTDLFNIEEILSILEMSEQLGGEVERSSFVEYIIEVIEHYTPKIKMATYPLSNFRGNLFGDVKENKNFSLYGYFVGSLLNLIVSQNSSHDFFCQRFGDGNRPARYSVITLNYDMVLENCFSHLRHFYHAENKIGFSLEIDEGDMFLQNTYLAKLHGSVDTKEIVPPTWNKGLNDVIKPAWQLAYKLLTEANHIRVIGYSLPTADAYIKYLLKAAVIECEHLKTIDVLCRDDHKKTVENRFNELICFPKQRFKNGDVLDYLEINRNVCVNSGESYNLQTRGLDSIHLKGLEIAHNRYFEN